MSLLRATLITLLSWALAFGATWVAVMVMAR
jgi:hypothetical protein